MGERSPINDMNARGTFIGLSILAFRCLDTSEAKIDEALALLNRKK